MALSLLYALIPVIFGAALAAAPGLDRRALGPLRTLALAAAVAVVGGALLPEAASALGGWTAAAFLLGLLGPVLAERAASAWLDREGGGLALALPALALHQLSDGLQVGAAMATSDDGAVVALAIAAHTAPLLAAVALTWAGLFGPRGALARVAALAGATALGVAVGSGAGAAPLAGAAPWIQAGLAGLLLHVLGHDLGEDPPLTPGQRALDLAALGLGLAGPLALMRGHGHDHGPLVALQEAAVAHPLVAAAALVLAAWVLRGMWREGVRAWIQARVPLQHHDHHVA
jgi:hypothetical protein